MFGLELLKKVFELAIKKSFLCLHHDAGASSSPILLRKGRVASTSTSSNTFVRSATKLASLKHEVTDYRMRSTYASRGGSSSSPRRQNQRGRGGRFDPPPVVFADDADIRTVIFDPDEATDEEAPSFGVGGIPPPTVPPEVQLLARLTARNVTACPVSEPDVFLKVVCVDDAGPIGARGAFCTWAKLKNCDGKLASYLVNTMKHLLTPLPQKKY